MAAGIFMILSGFFGFFFEFVELSPLRAVLNIYILLFGILTVLLEYKSDSRFMAYMSVVKREAHFLFDPYGRGCYYIFCGILLSVKGGILPFLIGLCVVAIGMLLIISTKTGNEKLRDLRNLQLDDQQIAAKFLEFDRDRNGGLDAAE